MSAGIVIVYTLYGDHHAAEAAAGEMVISGLAACANILSPGRSVYMWNDMLERQEEFPVLFRTGADRRDALMARIAETHSYDIPAILAWDAQATPPYAHWVGEMSGGA
ncbi:MAG: divalent-cation tolerance protein CutA [Sphingobium sp.]